MRHTSSALGLASASLLIAAGAGATPSQRPVAADSLEVNGAPIAMQAHHSKRVPPPALPGRPPADVAPSKMKAYSGPPIDVTQYHYDTLRTGWNQSETDLRPATVASSNFKKLKTLNVDGNVFAQPLLVSGYIMPDGSTHDLLIVATGHDSVYAFDAQTYRTLWQVSLGQPQSTNDVGCGDVKPEYGISSTPVIVRSAPNAGTLYVVAATEPASFSFHTQVHALDLGSGQDRVTPVEIDPSASVSGGGTVAFDPQNQYVRASLAWANGSVYVGIGSHCDNNAGAISGWLLRYGPQLNLEHAFNTIEAAAGYELASIWMTGFAPAINTAGKVFVVTGNGAYTKDAGGKDYGESVLALESSLNRVATHFTPYNYASLNNGDVDFGSGGVMLLPAVQGQQAPPLAVAMGKDAVLYLLNQSDLGGRKPNDAGALQHQRLGGSGGGLWGGPAYYGSPSGGLVYAQIDSDVLRAFSVNTGATPSLTQVAAGTSHAGYGGSLPIVSSNGANAGTGVVWLVKRGATEQLEAYDAVKLGAPLFAANAGTWSNPGQANSFVTPLEANGRVYVPAYKTVTVFGLTN